MCHFCRPLKQVFVEYFVFLRVIFRLLNVLNLSRNNLFFRFRSIFFLFHPFCHLINPCQLFLFLFLLWKQSLEDMFCTIPFIFFFTTWRWAAKTTESHIAYLCSSWESQTGCVVFYFLWCCSWHFLSSLCSIKCFQVTTKNETFYL